MKKIMINSKAGFVNNKSRCIKLGVIDYLTLKIGLRINNE